jgi:hypothetical protein
MEALKLIGKLKRIKDAQQVTDSFKKREFVIETDEQYPQTIGFELFQDKVSLIDTFNAGDIVEVFFNVRGREWQKDANSEIRVFNTLNAWRIQKVSNEAPAAQMPDAPLAADEVDDDLPF